MNLNLHLNLLEAFEDFAPQDAILPEMEENVKATIRQMKQELIYHK